MDKKNLPLSGITVVELATVVAAPTASRILSTFGADVIKIENIGGDVMRRFGASYEVTSTDTHNPCFTLTNSGKRFLSLNLKSEKGYRIMQQLLEKADVFISNVRPQSLKKLHLDYASLKDMYPRLIYAHFSGFGQVGPDKDRPGYDTCAFWLRCGAMLDWLTPGSFPIRPVYGFGDMATSAQLINGILMALLGRTRTGLGTEVTTSLFANGLWLNAFGVISAQPQYGRHFMADEYHPFDAFSDYYQCKDGSWLGFFCNEYAKERVKLSEVFSLPELLNDPDCKSIASMRASHKLEDICKKLRSIFLKKDRDTWCTILQEADIAYDKLFHYNELYKDEQAWANQYLENVSFENGIEAVIPSPPISFSEYGKNETIPTGSEGADSVHILTELGYQKDTINSLREQGIIR